MEPVSPHNAPRPVELKPNRRDKAREAIKHYIRSHQMKAGELLPPVRSLSEHFGVSRDAAWRALQQLQDEGWINARANRRYEISEEVYTRILGSLKVKVLFTGRNYINFTGFRRLADALKRECRYHNMELAIELLPLDSKPSKHVWDDCDVLMIDSGSSRGILKHFSNFEVPVIGLDAEYSDRYHLNVVTDHHMGGRLVAERLLGLDSKQVCMVYFENSPARIKLRLEGFRQVWLESGKPEKSLSSLVIPWLRNHFEVSLSLNEEMKGFDGKTDLFVTDGNLAVSLLEVLEHRQVSVPEDVRLIGYDATQMGGLTNPPMTTIQQDMDQIAKAAVARLVEVSNSRDAKGELVRIPPHLVERISG
ncbi:MAG: substrate-binding domain-containing protein [Puniceicoccaceae bacterium]